MTADEEFLKLAQDMGGDIEPGVVLRDENFVSFSEDNFLTYSREIERRTLEQAAVHFANQMDGSDSRDDRINEVLWAVVRELRAMIKEKK